MIFAIDSADLFLIARGLLAASLMLLGVVLLWQAAGERRPAMRHTHGARRLRPVPASSTRAAPPATPSTPRLATGAELQRLLGVMEVATSRVTTINARQTAAARHLDSAEMSLNRLLGEIADVMPRTIGPTIVPRRPVGA